MSTDRIWFSASQRTLTPRGNQTWENKYLKFDKQVTLNHDTQDKVEFCHLFLLNEINTPIHVRDNLHITLYKMSQTTLNTFDGVCNQRTRPIVNAEMMIYQSTVHLDASILVKSAII